MSYNIHTLLQLADTVRQCGPLWTCSMFPFEGFNRTLLKFCTGPTYIAEQILDKFLIPQTLGTRDTRTPDGSLDERVDALVTKFLSSRAVKAARSAEGVVALNAPRVRDPPRPSLRQFGGRRCSARHSSLAGQPPAAAHN